MKMKKKIFFDSRWIGEHGIGRFADEVRRTKLNFEDISLQGNPAGKFDTIKLTYFLFRNRHYFFSPGYNAPLFFLDRTIITIHDLNHIDLNYNSSFLKKIYYKFVLKRACKKSALIFTVSEFSKRRIQEWASIPLDKIKVVGNGVSDDFKPIGNVYNNNLEPYLLIVGNRKKHKNEQKAISAFFQADIPKKYQLLIVGDETEELNHIIKEDGSTVRVKFLGRVSNSELASLYRGAECLLFPSLYEGFGLPVIESMACGTPVITSNVTSLPEIAGDAAVIISPESVDEIKKAIERVIAMDHTAKDTMIKKGYAQVLNYSWEKTRAIVEKSIKEGFHLN